MWHYCDRLRQTFQKKLKCHSDSCSRKTSKDLSTEVYFKFDWRSTTLFEVKVAECLVLLLLIPTRPLHPIQPCQLARHITANLHTISFRVLQFSSILLKPYLVFACFQSNQKCAMTDVQTITSWLEYSCKLFQKVVGSKLVGKCGRDMSHPSTCKLGCKLVVTQITRNQQLSRKLKFRLLCRDESQCECIFILIVLSTIA